MYSIPVCTSGKKIRAMWQKGETEKLEQFYLLVEQAAVCTLRVRFYMLPIETDKPRMHHVKSADRQTERELLISIAKYA